MRENSQFTTMVHILVLLGMLDKPVSSTSMAGSVNTNPVVIRQMMCPLRKAAIVGTLPGSAGGTILKKDPAQITLQDIYLLTKKETLFGLHPNEPDPHCLVGRNIQCVLVEIFNQMDRVLESALAQVTIADIVAQVMQKEQTQSEQTTDEN